MREFRPQIVHTHTPKAGLLGMLAARLAGVPVRVHTVAGLPLMEATGLKRRVLVMAERLTYACAQRVYPNSKGLLEFIQGDFRYSEGQMRRNAGNQLHRKQSFGKRVWEEELFKVNGAQLQANNAGKQAVADPRFRLIGKGSSNGIDPVHFARTPELTAMASDIRARHHIPAEALVFGFVGRVVKDKGIVELVEAFRALAATANIRLLLVGPYEQELDPLPDEVMNFIRTDSRVIAAGYQQDVRPWIIASDVFVFPSYREGFPNVVMQAACLEVPCIVSDINGCNEIIEDESSGLVVPPKNTAALQEAMGEMMAFKDLRRSFAILARAHVIENFSQRYIWNEILKEYRTLLKPNKV
jgi:glycosyltransferase involved in cell wall biosynthesis